MNENIEHDPLEDWGTEIERRNLKGPLAYHPQSQTLVLVTTVNGKTYVFESRDSIDVRDVNSSSFLIEDLDLTRMVPFCEKTFKDYYHSADFDSTLFQEIRSLLEGAIYINRQELDMLPCYVLFTYLYPIFKASPYLSINGDAASGKTTLAEAIAALSFNGRHHTKTTLASARNDAHQYRGLVSFDNSEWMKNEDKETRDFLDVLCSSYSNTATVTVAGIGGTIREYLVGGPKAFNSIKIAEHVLLSRCVCINMKKAPEDFIKKVEIKGDQDFAREIRARAMVFALKNHREIVDTHLQLPKSANRDHDILSPLLAVASFIEKKTGAQRLVESIISTFDKSKTIKQKENQKDNFEGFLLESLWELWGDNHYSASLNLLNSKIRDSIKSLPCADVSSLNNPALKIKIGEVLSSLELVRSSSRPRTENGTRETSYTIATEILNSLFKKSFPQKWIEPPCFQRKKTRPQKTKQKSVMTLEVATEFQEANIPQEEKTLEPVESVFSSEKTTLNAEELVSVSINVSSEKTDGPSIQPVTPYLF